MVTTEAIDVEEARSVIKSQSNLDVILTEATIGNQDGLELVEELKQKMRSTAYVVVMTSSDDRISSRGPSRRAATRS